MALYNSIKGRIVRQELDIDFAGQHNKIYSGNVTYTPEHIESTDFFDLCYAILKPCDKIFLHTKHSDKYNLHYQFIVLEVNEQEKIVKTKLIRKIDLLTGKVYPKSQGQEDTQIDISAIVNKLEELVIEVTELKKDQEKFIQYTKDTDDQLEEIENTIKTLVKSNKAKA